MSAFSHAQLVGRDRLYNVVSCLAEECPWTKTMQSHDMLNFLSSEVKELQEEIEGFAADQKENGIGDLLPTDERKNAIISELGDLLFDVLMLEMMMRREYNFGINDAWDTAAKKVERRTPYMKDWGDGSIAKNSEEAEKLWQEVKRKEKEGYYDSHELATISEKGKGLYKTHQVMSSIVGFTKSNLKVIGSASLGFILGTIFSNHLTKGK